MAEGLTSGAQFKGRARIPPSTRAAWRSSRAGLIAVLVIEILKPLIHRMAVRITPAEPPQSPPV